jgi:hypothetical protein
MSSRQDLITVDAFTLEAERSLELANKLYQQKHYQTLGIDGILAILAQAKAIGIDPVRALNGGCYYVSGKVELSAQMMNQLIRKAGHSITVDKKSDDTCYTLHGKRRDNGDTMMISFSIEEAKKAGIYNKGFAWRNYPGDMLFARALSRLARRLFADVIGDCYVDGEISSALEIEKAIDQNESEKEADVSLHIPEEEPRVELCSKAQCEQLLNLVSNDDELKQNLQNFLNSKFGGNIENLPANVIDGMIVRLKKLQETSCD